MRQSIISRERWSVLDLPGFVADEPDLFNNADEYKLTGVFSTVPNTFIGNKRFDDEESTMAEWRRKQLDADEQQSWYGLVAVSPLVSGMYGPYVKLPLATNEAFTLRYESKRDDPMLLKTFGGFASTAVWFSESGEFTTVRRVEEVEPAGAYSDHIGFLAEPASVAEQSWKIQRMAGLFPYPDENHVWANRYERAPFDEYIYNL